MHPPGILVLLLFTSNNREEWRKQELLNPFIDLMIIIWDCYDLDHDINDIKGQRLFIETKNSFKPNYHNLSITYTITFLGLFVLTFILRKNVCHSLIAFHFHYSKPHPLLLLFHWLILLQQSESLDFLGIADGECQATSHGNRTTNDLG